MGFRASDKTDRKTPFHASRDQIPSDEILSIKSFVGLAGRPAAVTARGHARGALLKILRYPQNFPLVAFTPRAGLAPGRHSKHREKNWQFGRKTALD